MADTHSVSCQRWRLKNKTLTRAAKSTIALIEDRRVGRKSIEDILCSGFGFTALVALLPHELASLELSCCCLRGALSGESALFLWSASVYASLRCHRLMLPMEEFAGMTITQLKSMVSHMKSARGPFGGGLVHVAPGSEFGKVSSICKVFAQHKSNVRIIASRVHFTPRCFVCASEDVEDEVQEEVEAPILLGDEMSFFWPSNDSHTRGAMLKASLAFLPETILLEIRNVIKTSGNVLALQIDVHLVSPLWPEGLKAEGLKVRIDGSCVAIPISGLDASDEKVQQIVASDGVLCVLAIRGFPTMDAEDPKRPSH